MKNTAESIPTMLHRSNAYACIQIKKGERIKTILSLFSVFLKQSSNLGFSLWYVIIHQYSIVDAW